MQKDESLLEENGSHLLRCVRTVLDKRRAKGTLRQLRTFPSSSVDFSSNDFLSLSTSPAFQQQYLENLAAAVPTNRLASTGSRLLDGNSAYAERLERFIAAFHNAPCGLLFNSGFDANAGVFASLPQPGDVIIYDELIHASVHDGMRLSRAERRIPFKHNSVQSFENVLQEELSKNGLLEKGYASLFVAVESLYSMDGDFAPLRELLDILENRLHQRNGYMIVDEAHSTGVFGPKGAGVVQSLGLENRVFLRLHTFGKALAGNGGKPWLLLKVVTCLTSAAIILCSESIREYLVNYARPLIFSSAMGLPSLVLIRTAYEFMKQGRTEQVGLFNLHVGVHDSSRKICR
jgi:8-amino-7-oxononanoate synthase